MSKIVNLQGDIIEDNIVQREKVWDTLEDDGSRDHISTNEVIDNEVIDNTVLPIYELDADSIKDIEDHMNTLPEDSSDLEYIQNIFNLGQKFRDRARQDKFESLRWKFVSDIEKLTIEYEYKLSLI